ncbi:hypothetical protein PHYSODRAFT_491350 [Phytophthora sojae]|uniref:Uncharacterized protein n=1 Tax=Phytophthora sojae (strain P6497) TaxID=1094619 RepID=G4ZBM5_PHYSP|nr:hypothetical protein PHYSODRAFT_491350 [Phytophthora sojae]EGZ20639.1 hypothetical protein PHYSODRAFT_491350 [Phytophthora sojae]|eukprot:XP_009523356.1 hypothetical protein PHYSODRAFT_491350 [Phytophthora sojae]
MSVRDTFGASSVLVTLRHEPNLSAPYEWRRIAPETVKGVPRMGAAAEGAITLLQEPDGINWSDASVHGNREVDRDGADMAEYAANKGIVIEATPLLHGFPWLVPEKVRNKRVLQALKKQPFRQFRLGLGKHLGPLVDKLHSGGSQSERVKATQDQTPTALWA